MVVEGFGYKSGRRGLGGISESLVDSLVALLMKEFEESEPSWFSCGGRRDLAKAAAPPDVPPSPSGGEKDRAGAEEIFCSGGLEGYGMERGFEPRSTGLA